MLPLNVFTATGARWQARTSETPSTVTTQSKQTPMPQNSPRGAWLLEVVRQSRTSFASRIPAIDWPSTPRYVRPSNSMSTAPPAGAGSDLCGRGCVSGGGARAHAASWRWGASVERFSANGVGSNGATDWVSWASRMSAETTDRPIPAPSWPVT